MKQTRHLGVPAMKQAIQSVALHEQDYDGAPVEKRIVFHHLCKPEQFCKYQKYVHIDKKDPKDFVYQGPKKGGLLAPRDKAGVLLFEKYPDALPQIVAKFDTVFKPGVLEQATEHQTTNANESGHAVVWRVYLHKDKPHKLRKVTFGTRMFVLRHNFGTYKSSLHHKLGTMTSAQKKILQDNDKKTLQAASLKWIPTPLRYKKHRKKIAKSMQSLEGVQNLENTFNAYRKLVLAQLRDSSYKAGQGDGPLVLSDEEIDQADSP